jgi:hypothetical protein
MTLEGLSTIKTKNEIIKNGETTINFGAGGKQA